VNISSLRDPVSLKPWLLQIVANEARNRLRKKRVETVPLENAPDIGDDCDADEALIQDERHLALKEAVAALPEDQREAVTLHYFSGLTVPEIASALSTREGTVKSRLSRALAHIRKTMLKENPQL
jgi:RNA polymerase sigma factor (sigma-70 family)